MTRRKAAALMLAVVMILVLTGCGRAETVTDGEDRDRASEMTVSAPDKKAVLSEEDARRIEEILENGLWTDDTPKCEPDCILTVGGDTLTYHSECGTFSDDVNRRYLATDDDTRDSVNAILEKYITLGQVFD